MISVIQLALGGLAPPLLAIHLAFAGMAPVESVEPPPASGGARSGAQRFEPSKRKPVFVQARELEREAGVIEAAIAVAQQPASTLPVVTEQQPAERPTVAVDLASQKTALQAPIESEAINVPALSNESPTALSVAPGGGFEQATNPGEQTAADAQADKRRRIAIALALLMLEA